ncbi:proline dehydrogenase family protein [Demequina sp.]|uniref:proline dehydrogenase family protein n=1 Tax=Demequina sp. TaxID=2050685 RepID=UPI003D0EFFC9
MTVAADNAVEQAAIDQVHDWLARSQARHDSASTKRLARLVADPQGLAFTVAFVDGIIRPQDMRVAARNLARAARTPAPFLDPFMRTALKVGGRLAPLAPWLAVPVTRRVLRGLVGHLVLDSRPHKLRRGLTRLHAQGVKLNVNLLGEAVLGADSARQRRDGTIALIERPDVDYVSLKVSSVVAPHSAWGFDEAAAAIAQQLLPVYDAALRSQTFVNLDMEEYRDLDLTIEVFTRVLSLPQYSQLQAGIVLQAYLPDAIGAYDRLLAWASGRVRSGGAPIKVRVVKGANLSMERVDAEWHGWPLATWHSKEETDANYKRLLGHALTPANTTAVHIGVAGHNLFDLAYAWLLASQRGVAEAMDVEMLLGMAERIGPVVADDVGAIRLYTPVVPPAEFDVAIAYLVRRLEEVANPSNFLSSAFRFDDHPDALALEEARFRASLARMSDDVPHRHRGLPVASREDFANQPDTDPSTPDAREWAAKILARVPRSRLGVATVTSAHVPDVEAADGVVTRAVAAGEKWGKVAPAERARLLEAAASALEGARGELLEVMASEAGKTIDQGDPEVSEVVDFARYYAQSARALETVEGARPVPRAVTLVTPPWNFPVAIPGGSTLAALAAGSAVVLKPAPATKRCAAVLAEALWSAGIPQDVLQLVDCEEDPVGTALVSDERVDQIVLTGAYETAQLFTRIRPTARLLAETSGKNAIIVTPSADLDLAVRDVVQSAFGHAGQKCSAASLVVLVGSVARSTRFRTQLLDAARSIAVGTPESPTAQMGPVIEAPRGKLLDGLTRLDGRERWLLQPEPLNDEGTLWSPGIRGGVEFGAPSHLTEYFGPVLSVMTAPTLETAIETVNAVDYGLTSGLHSLDESEIALWLAQIDAGNLYVNRGITGAIVRRQPFGGWKRSAVGPSAKAGGPHYVERLTGWQSTASGQDWDAALRTALDRDYGATDPSGLACERNVLRFVPAVTEVRVGAGADQADVERVVAAAAAASPGSLVTFAHTPDAAVAEAVTTRGLVLVVEDDEAWAERVTSARWSRVRAVGELPQAARSASVAIYADPVTASARLELFPFLREQAISMTAHRFGTLNQLAAGVEFAAARSAS